MGPGRYSCCKDESIRPSLVLCPLEEGIFGAKTRGKKQQQLDKVVVLDWSYDQSRDLRSDASVIIAYSQLSNFLWGSKFLPPEWGHALSGLGGAWVGAVPSGRDARTAPLVLRPSCPRSLSGEASAAHDLETLGPSRPSSEPNPFMPHPLSIQQPLLFQRLDRSLTLSPTSVLAML